MPKVKFIRERREMEVPIGANLRREALKAGIQVYKGIDQTINCRGRGLCGTCRVLVKGGGMKNCSPRSLREWFHSLSLFLPSFFYWLGREEEMRLSCQTYVMGDIEVETQPPFNWHGTPFRRS